MVLIEDKEIWRMTLDGLSRKDREHMGLVVLDWPEARHICCRLYVQITDGRGLGTVSYRDAVREAVRCHRRRLKRSDWQRLGAFMDGIVVSLSRAPYRVHSRVGDWDLLSAVPLTAWAQGKGRLVQEMLEPLEKDQVEEVILPVILPERLRRSLEQNRGESHA